MIITIGHVRLTSFTADDTRELYEIRNHPTVRPFLGNPAPLDYAAHERWVRENLVDAQRLLLWMARRGDETFGFTLLRPAGDGTREIGAMFRDPDRHPLAIFHAGFGTLYYAIHVLRVALTSYLIPGHERARAFNLAFGAWETASDKPGLDRLYMTREVCLANAAYQKMLRRFGDRIRIEP